MRRICFREFVRNVTGFAVDEPGMGGKRLELLRQIAPDVKRVALLFNPATTVPVKFYNVLH